MRASRLVVSIVAGVAIFAARPTDASVSTAPPSAAKPILVGAPIAPLPKPTPTPTASPIPLAAQMQISYAQFQTGCAGTGLDASACLASLADGKLVFVGGYVSLGAIDMQPKRYGLFKTSRPAGSTVQAATRGWGGDTLVASGTLAPTQLLTFTGNAGLPGFRKVLPAAVHDCFTVRWFADDVTPDAAQSAPTKPFCRTWSGLPTTTTTYKTDGGNTSQEFHDPTATGERWQSEPCNPESAARLGSLGTTSGTYYRQNTAGTEPIAVAQCPGGTSYLQWSMGYHFANVQTGEGITRMRFTANAMPCAGNLYVTIDTPVGKRKHYVFDGSKDLDETVDTDDGLWPGFGHDGLTEDAMVEVFSRDGAAKCLSTVGDPKLEVTTLDNITTFQF